tara:strand:- start:387 stop:1217 length:831 start_codon:yes stop_codon:yes gene_type:complete
MDSKKIFYINGEWVSKKDANIPHEDAGFQRGYGLFETIRFENKKLFRPDKHYERLSNGLSNIKINFNKSYKEILSLLEQIIEKNKINSGLIRITITIGNIKDDPWDFNCDLNIYISIRSMVFSSMNAVKVKFYSEKIFPIVRFHPQIKSLNYLGNMLAKREAANDGFFEPVFYNHEQVITECAVRNIFFIKNQIIFTPSTKLGVLPGIMRETVLEAAKSLNYDISLKNILLKDINLMDEAFITSTAVGVLPCFWGNWKSNYKICLEIKDSIQDKYF